MSPYKNILLILLFLFFGSECEGQHQKREKWTNKDKGTYTISFSYMPVIPKDNPSNVGISIRMYELSDVGCKRIEGWAKINGKKHFVYDSTMFVDNEGERDISNYFFIQSAEGSYEIIADPGNDYYPVKTEKVKLLKMTSYGFNFYFVRKDALKRG